MVDWPPLDYGGIVGRKKREYIAAIHAAMGQDYEPMVRVFTSVLRRTVCIGDDPTLDDAMAAWLVCRDELAGRMDRRDAQVTLGLLRGLSQRKIGRQLGIDQSAVAHRFKRNGAYAILMARERLEAIAKGEGWPGGSAVPVDPVRGPGSGGGSKPGKTGR